MPSTNRPGTPRQGSAGRRHGDGVARPDVGDAAGDHHLPRSPQQQRTAGQRLHPNTSRTTASSSPAPPARRASPGPAGWAGRPAAWSRARRVPAARRVPCRRWWSAPPGPCRPPQVRRRPGRGGCSYHSRYAACPSIKMKSTPRLQAAIPAPQQASYCGHDRTAGEDRASGSSQTRPATRSASSSADGRQRFDPVVQVGGHRPLLGGPGRSSSTCSGGRVVEQPASLAEEHRDDMQLELVQDAGRSASSVIAAHSGPARSCRPRPAWPRSWPS